MSTTVSMRFVIDKPLKGVDYGVQQGKGKDYETLDTQRGDGKKLTLRFSIDVQQKNGMPNFTGPIAQGSPKERFVYVDIGSYAGQDDIEHGGRMKVPLGEISWNMIQNASRNANDYLEARLPGEQTATTRPIDGWKVVSK